MLSHLTYKPFGARAILIEWPARIDEQILADIIKYKDRIMSLFSGRLEDCVIAYHSLLILYKEDIVDFELERNALAGLYLREENKAIKAVHVWKIPVCYDEAFGIDLTEMSVSLDLSIDEIINLHLDPLYTVYFIGFLPGFLYLGGLDNRLSIKRKSDPRLDVAKGSVAIGGIQTGVYPQDSAGGWNIIGRTPISFFNPNQDEPCFAKPGDKIQFVAIRLEEYHALANNPEVEPKKLVWNG